MDILITHKNNSKIYKVYKKTILKRIKLIMQFEAESMSQALDYVKLRRKKVE